MRCIECGERCIYNLKTNTFACIDCEVIYPNKRLTTRRVSATVRDARKRGFLSRSPAYRGNG